MRPLRVCMMKVRDGGELHITLHVAPSSWFCAMVECYLLVIAYYIAGGTIQLILCNGWIVPAGNCILRCMWHHPADAVQWLNGTCWGRCWQIEYYVSCGAIELMLCLEWPHGQGGCLALSSPAEVALIYALHVALRGYCPWEWGCDQSIESTVSDAIVRSWLWLSATRSSPLGCFSTLL